MTTKKPTTKHRGRNEGSITQRKDGRWQAYIPLEDGTRRYKYGTTRQAVAEWLSKSLYEKQQHALLEPSHLTVGEYLRQWFEGKQLELKAGTKQYYRRIMDDYLIPKIGTIKLVKLSAHHIQVCYQHLLEGDKDHGALTPATIELAHHAVLSAALKKAVKMRLLTVNQAEFVTLPRKVAKQTAQLSFEQMERLIAVARGHFLEGLLTLALRTAMRQGELLALHWEDVDLVNGKVQVHRSVSFRDPDGTSAYHFREEEPKTQAGYRTIPLSADAIETLRHHRIKQHEIRLASTAWTDMGLVFPNAHGGYCYPSHVTKHFKHLLSRAELPDIPFHGLRGSVISFWLIKLGMNPEVVRLLAGHSTIQMTYKHYTVVSEGDKMKVAEKMNEWISKAAHG